jgi:hypothetical protein
MAAYGNQERKSLGEVFLSENPQIFSFSGEKRLCFLLSLLPQGWT